MLRSQIEYKAKRLGIRVILADTFFPSTQTCSQCGYRREGDHKLVLNDRVFTCPGCGFTLDRDLNAARNLAALGLKAQTEPDCLGS